MLQLLVWPNHNDRQQVHPDSVAVSHSVKGFHSIPNLVCGCIGRGMDTKRMMIWPLLESSYNFKITFSRVRTLTLRKSFNKPVSI